MAVLDPACVDFCIENVARLDLTQQEALDAHLTSLSHHALIEAAFEAALLAVAIVVAKEREHSVEHLPDFVNLVRLVHGLVRLIDQVQEAPECNEAVAFHDFPEVGVER